MKTNILADTRQVLIIDSPQAAYFDVARLQSRGKSSELTVQHVRGLGNASAQQLNAAHALVLCHGNRLTRRHIDALVKCQGIVVATTGFDHVDVAAAWERNIPVCNIPNYGSEDVADHTILLMLACMRRLGAAQASLANDAWQWQASAGAMRLRGKTLGIIGLGRVGRAVAQRACAFGMGVAFYDPFVASPDTGFTRIADLDTLLTSVDILSIHCPLKTDTTHLVDARALSRLRKGAIVVNTARGTILDQHALLCALKSGHLGGAGLDVLQDEPAVPTELREHSGVLLTPHMAFYSQESLEDLRSLALDAAVNFLEGRAEGNALVRMQDEAK